MIMSLLSLPMAGLVRPHSPREVRPPGFFRVLWRAFVAEQQRRAEFYRLDDVSPEQVKELKFLGAKRARGQ